MIVLIYGSDVRDLEVYVKELWGIIYCKDDAEASFLVFQKSSLTEFVSL